MMIILKVGTNGSVQIRRYGSILRREASLSPDFVKLSKFLIRFPFPEESNLIKHSLSVAQAGRILDHNRISYSPGQFKPDSDCEDSTHCLRKSAPTHQLCLSQNRTKTRVSKPSIMNIVAPDDHGTVEGEDRPRKEKILVPQAGSLHHTCYDALDAHRLFGPRKF